MMPLLRPTGFHDNVADVELKESTVGAVTPSGTKLNKYDIKIDTANINISCPKLQNKQLINNHGGSYKLDVLL